MNRRSFLRRASGLVVAAVAAPLYIPSERLAFGVPTGRALEPDYARTQSLADQVVARYAEPKWVIRPHPFAYENMTTAEVIRCIANEAGIKICVDLSVDETSNWTSNLRENLAAFRSIELDDIRYHAAAIL